MITYQVESYLTARDDDLIRMHYEEIALHQDDIPLNPDWNRYDLMDATGDLLCMTARDDGKLIGYSVFILSWHLHYNSTRMASNDVLFLHPNYRRGRHGLGLILFCEQELQKHRVQKIVWHIKFSQKEGDRRDFSPILYRLGYQNEDKIVGKMLPPVNEARY